MRRNFFLKVVLPLLAVGAFVTAVASGLHGEEKEKTALKELYDKLDLFTDALTIIEKSYVDEVNFKDLVYGALKGALRSLDPHSAFLEPDEYKDIQVETEGEFGGIGIEITVKDKHLTIVTPLDDTPAQKAGLQSGDRIVKIDGVSTEDLNLDNAVTKLRGNPGSKITLTISRPSKKEVKDFTLARVIIKIESVKDAKIIPGNIGYLRITQFQDRTTEEMDKALRGLQTQGMKSLILDLRNNPGGLLQEAIDVADRFLGDGKMIVYTKGRMPEQTVDFKGRSGPAVYKMPMVVLINNGSASGAEIVAGALQDWKRAVLLGTKSFGKGSVQSVLPLKDGAALKLTTAKYFTPLGRSIHNKGIEPDIKVEIPEQDEMNLMLAKVDSLDESGTKLSKQEEVPDTQLERAVDLLKGIGIFMGEKTPATPKTVTTQVKAQYPASVSGEKK